MAYRVFVLVCIADTNKAYGKSNHGIRSSKISTDQQARKRIIAVSHLTPYETGWTIKVRATRKGILRAYRKAYGEGHVFHIELTDDDNTAIEACMFDDAALHFYDTFQVGKTYYISKAKVHVANKKFSRLENLYELILDMHSIVEQSLEAEENSEIVAGGGYDFVKIDHLEAHINTRSVIDVIGIVCNVSPVSVRRTKDNVEILKREVTIEDQSGKSVRITLWGDLALKDGQALADIAHQIPVVTFTSVRATDFLGVSLSTTIDTIVQINPCIAAAEQLHSWYEAHGKAITCTPAGASLPRRYTELDPMANRAFLSDVLSVHAEKATYFNVKATITYIDPDQPLWYQGCKSCAKKVTEENDRFWCHACQANVDSRKRYILSAKLADFTAETVVTAFNDEAQDILGHSADDLCELRSKDTDQTLYQHELRRATWIPKLFRLSVLQTEYMTRQRQRIVIRQVAPIDCTIESNFLLQHIAQLK